ARRFRHPSNGRPGVRFQSRPCRFGSGSAERLSITRRSHAEIPPKRASALDLAAMNVAATLPPLAGRARPEQADACREFLDAAHARIRAAHDKGAPGDLTARDWAAAADEVVRALFRAASNSFPGLDVW